MELNRRTLLGLLATAPLAAIANGCCRRGYPAPLIGSAKPVPAAASILRAASGDARAAMIAGTTRVVDVHAHFFNASDVPVRGFVAESIGHRAPAAAQVLLRALSPIADALADQAPTAAEELETLRGMLEAAAGPMAASADPSPIVNKVMDDEAKKAARRVTDATRNSEFQRRYREMKQRPGAASSRSPSETISPDEVLQVVDESRKPAAPGAAGAPPRAAAASADEQSDAADGILGFLFYMLSNRSSNLDAYMDTYARGNAAFGIDKVLGSLVDFDYWLDCPPMSAHDDQVELHALISKMSGGFMKPVVAYNPWTDINQNGAGLARVVRAVKNLGFVAVKIYPPTGFRPAGNATTATQTTKRRPDLKKLDERLQAFFDTCAAERIPIIAHANRTNGRDIAHDEFSRPDDWRAMLARYASAARTPVIDVGHFGGASGDPSWTEGFAKLMADSPKISLYGDLGYWDELMCPGEPDAICRAARRRLGDVLATPINPADGVTVADRVMFGTDWLMLSQVKRWADYPASLFDSVKDIAPNAVDKIFGGNAATCFGV
jgi:predicted TIM-barrel fold metal-dependent hydrolase